MYSSFIIIPERSSSNLGLGWHVQRKLLEISHNTLDGITPVDHIPTPKQYNISKGLSFSIYKERQSLRATYPLRE